ncbi:hypothetical protein [Hoylesella loescheii]|uniref:Uncharacterized protein n=1 Tax=Hoylesella loescheii DSM 19665 = JCM 12249 = ATCC 15930 TaxID=1122985 RepID=A0A069QPA9_HOYLO|nr:hypothetical protein [Hoylesella loescheii]KDR53869.1 hypothetical protein HMPREF1991_00033 [Hoylesella loescheii DSM 19665 = JCM 12249 = ATCC 15930]
MKVFIFIITVTIVVCVSCTKRCRYQDPIEDLLVMDWGTRPLPHHGKVYSFREGTLFTELIDSFELSIIERNPARTNWIVCSLGEKKPTHRCDIRLTLDDSLTYDISNITLSWFIDQKHWTMGGPREYCIVSSFKVNGKIVDNSLHSGRLALPQKYVRIIKKR